MTIFHAIAWSSLSPDIIAVDFRFVPELFSACAKMDSMLYTTKADLILKW